MVYPTIGFQHTSLTDNSAMSFVKEMPRVEYQLPPPQMPQVGLGVGVGVGVGVGIGVGVGTHQMPAVVGLPGTLPHMPAQEEPARWSQYQQLWRQHVYMNAYTCREESAYRDYWTFRHASNSKPSHGHGHAGVKELPSSVLGGPADDKVKDDTELWSSVEAQTSFLGPNLWDKTYETDLKYVDLDEFLSENGVSMDGSSLGGLGGPAHAHALPKRERSPSPSDCMSPDTLNPPSPADSIRDFDPRTRAFSDEDLKPQPMIKKSRKQFVPDSLKDDKYWARRRKNNMAAKRSRDARRMKENQIALRAGYLEKENMGLRQELERLKKENLLLRDKLSKCGDV